MVYISDTPTYEYHTQWNLWIKITSGQGQSGLNSNISTWLYRSGGISGLLNSGTRPALSTYSELVLGWGFQCTKLFLLPDGALSKILSCSLGETLGFVPCVVVPPPSHCITHVWAPLSELVIVPRTGKPSPSAPATTRKPTSMAGWALQSEHEGPSWGTY